MEKCNGYQYDQENFKCYRWLGNVSASSEKSGLKCNLKQYPKYEAWDFTITYYKGMYEEDAEPDPDYQFTNQSKIFE